MFFCNYPLLTFSPKYDLPGPDPVAQTRKMLVCHSCGEMGHKSFNCPKAIQDIVARDGEGKPVEDRKVQCCKNLKNLNTHIHREAKERQHLCKSS